MTTAEPIDPRSEISFLKKVIEDSRRTIVFDVAPFLVWGGLVVAGALLEYLLPWLAVDIRPVWMWMALMGIGWLYSLGVVAQRRARAHARTLADRALAGLWIGCWTAMTLVGFVGFFSGHLAGAGISASLAIILGAGYYATGVLVAHRGVRLLGVAWWLSGVGLFLWKSPHSLAVFALMIILLQIVPGLVLQRRWRSELQLP